MSTTSARPWAVSVLGDIIGPDRETIALIGSEGLSGPLSAPPPRDTSDADLIVTAVNAFEALLAVAKAAAQDVADSEKDMSPIGQIADAIDVLDAAHPGWREWTP